MKSDGDKESVLLQCYNKGCGAKYDATCNKEDACQFHPGTPVFHDAYKGWSCCNKKVTDFTEFLNIPGCTKGFHSNIKPIEPEKPKKQNNEEKNEVIVVKAPKPTIRMERPAEDKPLQYLPCTVAPSLKTALEKQMEAVSINENANDNEVKDGDVPYGTVCKNSGCKSSFAGEASNHETCVFHPGVPVFHEGMKYWSCCMRKTSDFDEFLKQEGCDLGKHVWIKTQDASTKRAVACRFDWHQTGSHVIITVYAKMPDPHLSYVEANEVVCNMFVTFEKGTSVFEKQITLNGVIDVGKSSTMLSSTKLEIKLKKAEPVNWPKLEYNK